MWVGDLEGSSKPLVVLVVYLFLHNMNIGNDVTFSAAQVNDQVPATRLGWLNVGRGGVSHPTMITVLVTLPVGYIVFVVNQTHIGLDVQIDLSNVMKTKIKFVVQVFHREEINAFCRGEIR